MPAVPPPFHVINPAGPPGALVVGVPHAGRRYPAALVARARVALAGLESLEDRFVDRLIDGLIADGATAVVADLARAAIDLNRDPREVDPAMVEGALPFPPLPSPRVRAGLGLLPRRLAREGDLWRHRIDPGSIVRLIETVHRPYHQAIADRLQAARGNFGEALLLDCHSMPPLHGADAPRIVIGTLHGRSVGRRFVDRAAAVVAAAGLSMAIDAPYAGGHTLERHGRPVAGIHAIQIEIDRSLYLADDLLTPDPAGMAQVARLLRTMARAMHALIGDSFAEAAE